MGLQVRSTRTLLSEALGPEVTISFRPGTMVIAIDERILTAGRRGEWLGRLRKLGDRATEAGHAEGLRNARAQVFSGKWSWAADGLSYSWAEFVVGRVRSCGSLTGGGGLWNRGVRLPV